MQISNMMSAFFVEEKQGSDPVFDRIGSGGTGTMTGGPGDSGRNRDTEWRKRRKIGGWKNEKGRK